MTIFVCEGVGWQRDECQNCGGSASLGGTQDRLVTDIGTFCSTDCHDEAQEFRERVDRQASRVTGCRSCDDEIIAAACRAYLVAYDARQVQDRQTPAPG